MISHIIRAVAGRRLEVLLLEMSGGTKEGYAPPPGREVRKREERRGKGGAEEWGERGSGWGEAGGGGLRRQKGKRRGKTG